MIQEVVEEGRDQGFVSQKDAENDMPSEPTPACLYGNPKTHKSLMSGPTIPLFREIVANSGSNCEGLGKLVDAITRLINEKAYNFVMDTPDFLRKIIKINRSGQQPQGTFLFTSDVKALYPSVPSELQRYSASCTF